MDTVCPPLIIHNFYVFFSNRSNRSAPFWATTPTSKFKFGWRRVFCWGAKHVTSPRTHWCLVCLFLALCIPPNKKRIITSLFGVFVVISTIPNELHSAFRLIWTTRFCLWCYYCCINKQLLLPRNFAQGLPFHKWEKKSNTNDAHIQKKLHLGNMFLFGFVFFSPLFRYNH